MDEKIVEENWLMEEFIKEEIKEGTAIKQSLFC